MKFAVGLLMGLMAGAGGMYAYTESQPSLPYTEPHDTVEVKGKECAMWTFGPRMRLFICEGERPVIAVKRKKPEYSS